MRPTGTDPRSSKASIHKVLQNKRDIIHKTNEDQRISDSIEELLLQFDPQIQYRCYPVIKREEDQPRNFIKIHCNMTGMKDVSSFDEQTFFKLLRKLKYLFSITIKGLPLTYLPSDLLEKMDFLYEFNVQGTRIEKIPHGFFSNNQYLYRLILAHNKLQEFHSDLLTNVKELLLFSLIDNKIEYLSPNLLQGQKFKHDLQFTIRDNHIPVSILKPILEELPHSKDRRHFGIELKGEHICDRDPNIRSYLEH